MEMEMNPETTFEFDLLSKNNIDRAENAINSDKLQPIENNYKLSISYQYYDDAEIGYKEMIKESTPVTSYFRFAGNGYGYQSYGFYKAKNGNVYILDTSMEHINGVFIPDKNIDCFKNIIV